MFIIQNDYKLYGRDLCQDLISSSGYDQNPRCVPNDWPSYAAKFTKYRGHNNFGESYTKPTLAIIEDWPPFDADLKLTIKEHWTSKEDEEDFWDEIGYERETSGTFDPAVSKYNTCLHRRALDGDFRVGHDVVEAYMGNLLLRERKGNLSAYERKYGTQININTNDEEGDGGPVYEIETKPEFEDIELTPSEASDLAQELLFHMKRLYMLGACLGVCTLEFISAYLRAEAKLEYDKKMSGANKSVTRSLTSNDVIHMGYNMADAVGDPARLATEKAKHPACHEAFEWITGITNKYQSYLEDYNELIVIARKLHVDLLHEDMSKYNSDFWNKIVVSYITPDKLYIKELTTKLRNNTAFIETTTTKDALFNVLRTYQYALEMSTELLDRYDYVQSTEVQKNLFKRLQVFLDGNGTGIKYYNLRQRMRIEDGAINVKVINIHDIYFKDSIAYYEGEILLFNCSNWSRIIGLSNHVEKRLCLLSSLYLFIDINPNDFCICDVQNAVELFNLGCSNHQDHDIVTNEIIDTTASDLREIRNSWRVINPYE